MSCFFASVKASLNACACFPHPVVSFSMDLSYPEVQLELNRLPKLDPIEILSPTIIGLRCTE